MTELPAADRQTTIAILTIKHTYCSYEKMPSKKALFPTSKLATVHVTLATVTGQQGVIHMKHRSDHVLGVNDTTKRVA
jgi:hypothetical protein